MNINFYFLILLNDPKDLTGHANISIECRGRGLEINTGLHRHEGIAFSTGHAGPVK